MNAENKGLKIPVMFEVKPQEETPLAAFLFTRSGKLIEKTLIQKEMLEFKSPLKNLREYRLFIAPAADKKIDTITSIAELDRFKPYEPVLNLDPRGAITILPIPDYLSKLWRLRMCRIRGRVIKNFSIGSHSLDKGICNARVHICEVDRIWYWIRKIPDHIILRIPEIILKPDWPIPVPEPEPGPFPDSFADLNPQPLPPKTFPFSDLTRNAVNINAVTEFKTAQSFSAAREMIFTDASLASNLSTRVQQSQESLQMLPDVKSQLLSGNVATIRKTIADYYHIFHPYLCYIPWIWPYFYRCSEIDVVYTDANGNFDTNYWYWYDGDEPDIYFWVEYLINGVWTTVYNPPKPCYTYWNYTCGSSVTIRLTDPRVRWECNNVIDGDIVWVKTIGSAASVVHIQQTDLISTIQGKSFNRIGLSDVSVWASGNAIGDYRRPFGSELGFVVQFGSGLPSNGMYYYRWAYRKIRNEDLSVLPLTTPVSLHAGQTLYKSYTYEYFDVFMHKHFASNAFKLGPFSKNGVDDLFIIPPAYPTSAPVNATELSPQWDQNTWTISFDSTKLSGGLYEFFLELFDFNGNKLASIPKQIFQTPLYNDMSQSEDAPDKHLVLNGLANADAFKMKARIDNYACGANIYKIKVNGSEVSTDCCGFVPYPPGANIEVAFRAYHPNNFATFGFTVQKGTCNDPSQSAVTDAGGMVIGDANGYNRNSSSIYRKTFTAAQLLGICTTGGKAAFAEYLNLHALATNGSNQLYFLNNSALAAFALEPA
jgi:hypothetical protein